MSSSDDPAAACPVDHKTREAWLAQARAQNPDAPPNPHSSTSTPPASSQPQTQTQAQSQAPVQASCDSSALDQNTKTPTPTATGLLSHLRLGTDREVSTIPRALPSLPAQQQPQDPSAAPARAANNEIDTGSDKKTGNWIYPSERMFFEAMRRKSYDPSEADMKTIVPIHNAVNERAWYEIKQWEAGRGADACGGPRLSSFSGLSTSLTPRARWKSFLGYQKPFDRHDWVVDRCGTEVEYVIDFYAGKDEGKSAKGLNFYLDVRPKLNSFEGVKMRVAKYWGL
ncbi:cytochrome c and c1 heme-lyase [Cucurbitaria berberidis CBS 394.84]|uniref:Holocytochrome c-type synthase n=1 Tax=Cucurbitaria berberidis CBS 394.84 TaxID=1168544 RepID=A0A9P4GQS2_9PLEO|nr:cytochrome c and c1 heme-lyase [Cucurbitaria berberidis CBS 394.84]KAF1849595.1 cytochrome c and c1 heme-lyase [Cucurbitaria berberidis CBS 394.84]